MTSTATKPSASGSAAAASEPKTSSRMSRTSGKPAVSALARSSLESSCIAAHSAPWPTSEVVTPSRAPSPAPRFSRRSTARSVAASSSTATRSGTTTVPPAAARRSASRAGGGGERDARRRARRRRRPARPRRGAAPASRRAPASAPRRAARAARPGSRSSASSTAADAEPGTPKPPLERCSDWRAANGSAASRITAQPIRTSRRRRRRRRSRRSIAVCTGRAVLGEEETGWLASQGTR